jgi:UrcA family protein
MFKVTHRSQGLRTATLLIALACGAPALAAQPAAANGDMTGIKVSYGDLNLASEQGKQVLLARIRSAARRACFAQEVDIRDLQAVASERVCENTAFERAVPSMRNAAVRRDATTLGQ